LLFFFLWRKVFVFALFMRGVEEFFLFFGLVGNWSSFIFVLLFFLWRIVGLCVVDYPHLCVFFLGLVVDFLLGSFFFFFGFFFLRVRLGESCFVSRGFIFFWWWERTQVLSLCAVGFGGFLCFVCFFVVCGGCGVFFLFFLCVAGVGGLVLCFPESPSCTLLYPDGSPTLL